MQVNGHFLPLEYSCCNFCITAKIHYLHPLSGCGTAFLRNTAKPLFFLLPFLFQCLTHTEKALKDFLPVTQSRHGAGRVIHTNLDYCQSLYISFIFAVLIIANLFSITANNLIYDAEEKNGLFAATSATRVIIFAVRISFLIRSQ